ncbi:MAG: methyltransferase domain-containing protein [Candidatus Omnitrophica bacterium]|nr:methyltransferase domain-containing protein [Candidatus Omnitrophota bacterium]
MKYPYLSHEKSFCFIVKRDACSFFFLETIVGVNQQGESLSESDPREFRLEQARENVRNGQIEEGIRVVAALAEEFPDFFDAHGNLAYWLTLTGENDRAICAYQECCEIAPRLPEPHRRLGFLLLEENRFENAIPVFERLVELTPDDAEALEALGECHLTQNRVVDAKGVFENLHRILPENHKATLRLTDCLLELRQRRQAARLYQHLAGIGVVELGKIQARFPLVSSVSRSSVALIRSFFRHGLNRFLSPRFLASFGSEIGTLPSSLKVVRKYGSSLFLRYLEAHFFLGNHYKFPKSPCDLCGSQNFRTVFFHGHQKKVKCEDCGLECVERKPSESLDVELETYDSDEVLSEMDEIWSSEGFISDRAHFIHRVFEEAGLSVPGEGCEIFEFGSAQGQVLEFFSERGAQVRGIETSSKLTAYCRRKKGLEVDRNTVRGLNPEASAYDFVVAFHVLEHLDRPSELFAKAHEMLREGGFLLIEVPSADLEHSPLAHQLNLKHGYVNEAHLNYFQPPIIEGYLKKYGFDLLNSYDYFVDFVRSSGFLARKVSR